MSTIPASELVVVNPSVIGAGGSALDVVCLALTTNTRVPIGTVLGLPNAAAVATYFGPTAKEASFAATYFSGFIGSNKLPANLLFAQYNTTAVAAYIRGGNISTLTLAQLQALAGALNIVVDGYPRNASSINLSGVTSFSNAAASIQTSLNAGDPTAATITAALGATATASIATGTVGGTMTVTAVTGLITIGDAVTGTGGGVTACSVLSQLTGAAGGTGTYSVSVSQTVVSGTLTISSNLLSVTGLASGTVAVGQSVTGAGVTEALITAQASGSVGGTGTYTIVGAPQQVASETMTTTGTPVTVTYDSVSGAFVVTSGYTGVGSTVAFATGTLAASLLLTQATGAVLSQGAVAVVTPAAFMNAAILANSNFVTFATLFDPDNGVGSTLKQAFAAWKNTQNNRFAYVCWDNDITPTQSVPAAASLGQILANNNDSGTALEWTPDNLTGPTLAAFVAGAAASIDFTQQNGRITFAYKAQAGLAADVSDPTMAQNLAGNPQSAGRGNGYNFYGAYGAANQNFVWFQRGFVTGTYLWLDSYINQVWLNNQFQIAVLQLLQNTKSIPYNAAGNSLIAAALNGPIAAGLNFGAFAPGTISAAEVSAVNAQAGTNVAGVLQAQGYYLQILQASATVRAARGSPPCTFWYLDRGSVQALSLSSVAVQ